MYYSDVAAYNQLWNVYGIMIMYVGPGITRYWMKWKMSYNNRMLMKNKEKKIVVASSIISDGIEDVIDVKNSGIVLDCVSSFDVDRLNVNGE
jgi:hypothetical protein